MRSSSIPLRNPNNRKQINQSLGELLGQWFISTMQSMFSGLLATLIFIISPIWNYPERMKQLTHWFVICLGAITILWGLYWFGQRPVFNIEQISVQSANEKDLDHIKISMIKAKAINQFSGNFFTLRLDQARTTFEEMPWVRVASVRRVWPNQIQVSIEEHEPIGVWLGQNGPELMNNHGELFTVNLAEANDRKNLVIFQGPPNSNKEVLGLYQQLEEWFKQRDSKIVALTLSPRYAWSVKLDNGLSFELGRDPNDKERKQITERLDKFFRLWPELEKQLTGPVDYVDLRYNSGFSLGASSKSNHKTNEFKLAGLNQRFSTPSLEGDDESEEFEKTLTIKKQGSKSETKSVAKINSREIKKVKQSEQIGSKH
jgi:cell division protein FtsQ